MPANEFNAKLIDVQKRLNAPKSRKNTFGGYQYRSAEDILEAVKPLLAEQGLLLTISDDIIERGGRVYVQATAKVADGNGSTAIVTAFAREDESKKGMDASQLTGATSSYARKYALNGLFLIDDDKDADTDEYQRRTQDAPVRATDAPQRTEPSQSSNSISATPPTPLRANEHVSSRPAPGQEPSDRQVNYARSLWKQLGHTVVDPDGGDHHDAKTLDSHCQMLFKTDFAAINKNQMRTLIDNLLGQISAGKKGA